MSETSQELACTELGRSFEQATRRSGLVTRNVEIGGRLVALRFAGAALRGPLTRAFSPLAASGGGPALTICVADSASTGVVPRLETRLGRPGSSALRCIYVPDSGAVHCFDAARGVAATAG